jgi:hypothetical protein
VCGRGVGGDRSMCKGGCDCTTSGKDSKPREEVGTVLDMFEKVMGDMR